MQQECSDEEEGNNNSSKQAEEEEGGGRIKNERLFVHTRLIHHLKLIDYYSITNKK